VRLVVFCNEMMGLGHLRRGLVVASSLVSSHEDSTALVVTGSHALSAIQVPAAVDVIKLPTAAVDAQSAWLASAIRPPARLALAASDIQELRAQLSLTAVRSFRPDVVLVDYSPVGRDGDLIPALEWLRAENECTTALGLWEVSDRHDQSQWTPERIAAVRGLYDLVIIYGEPSPDDVRVGLLRAAGIPVETTGVIGAPPAARAAEDLGVGYLLVTAGGGADGYPLLDTALAAMRERPLPVPAVLVAGPLMSREQFAELTRAAKGLDAQVHRVRTDMDAVIAGARAIVSMAGYNTVAEVLGSGKPALLVPRAFPRDEQLRRARRWAVTGRLDLLEPDGLTPSRLRSALDRLFEQPPNQPEELTGADDIVRLLSEAIQYAA
jgi:predicted glycosyltransferase